MLFSSCSSWVLNVHRISPEYFIFVDECCSWNQLLKVNIILRYGYTNIFRSTYVELELMLFTSLPIYSNYSRPYFQPNFNHATIHLSSGLFTKPDCQPCSLLYCSATILIKTSKAHTFTNFWLTRWTNSLYTHGSLDDDIARVNVPLVHIVMCT